MPLLKKLFIFPRFVVFVLPNVDQRLGSLVPYLFLSLNAHSSIGRLDFCVRSCSRFSHPRVQDTRARIGRAFGLLFDPGMFLTDRCLIQSHSVFLELACSSGQSGTSNVGINYGPPRCTTARDNVPMPSHPDLIRKVPRLGDRRNSVRQLQVLISLFSGRAR